MDTKKLASSDDKRERESQTRPHTNARLSRVGSPPKLPASRVFLLVLFAMLATMGMGCPAKEQIREEVKPVAKPTIAVIFRWQTRDPRWESFLKGAANEVLVREGYDILSGPGNRSYSPEQTALLNSLGYKAAAAQKSSLVEGAELVVEVAAWLESKGAEVRGGASVKFLEMPTQRLLGSATAFGNLYSKDSQGNDLQSAKEAIQRAVLRVSQQYSTRQRKETRAGASYEVHIVAQGKLGDLDDQIVTKLRSSGYFAKVQQIASGDRRVKLQCHSRHDSAEVKLHLRQVLKGIPSIRSVRFSGSWRRMFVVLLNPA